MNSNQAYEIAWNSARHNADGSVVEDSLIEQVAANIDFNVEKARLGLARRIVARRKRPGQTAPDGKVCLPTLEPYAYEPSRLLADNDGNVTENQSATVKFKVAEAGRAQDDVERAAKRAKREQTEAGHFSIWAAEQFSNGRDPREITWDTCVRETGLWKDEQPEPADMDDEDLDDLA